MRRLILAAMLTLSGLGVAAPPALAIGNTILVNTTQDGEFPADGKCSLVAAIMESNNGGSAGYCTMPGTADADIIHFNLGSGLQTITLTADLPAITAPVTIDGGGTKARITGSGSLTTGLDVQAGGTTIRGMVIDGFTTGIAITGAANVTLTSNIVGPNSDAGILASVGDSNLHIGGVTDTTPGDACNDDCNLISGNTRVGIEAHGGGVIEGNYVGTNVAGKQANANGIGLLLGDGTWVIGGNSVPERNVISGNTGDGLELIDCTCTVQGNYIGTTVDGGFGLGNGGDGVDVDRSYTSMIGGPVFGTPNVISGNGGNGINIDTDVQHTGAVLTIYANRIGISGTGKALGNGGDGIHIGDFAPRVVVGSVGSHTANKIAYNVGAGVRVIGAPQIGDEIRGNSIHDNGDRGIALESGANNAIAPPAITGVGPLTGTACAHCEVDIFSDKADEGRTYQGSVMADSAGHWTFTDPVYGPNATATNTDSNHNTSEFSAPVIVSGGGGGGGGGAYQPDGRIALWNGAYAGNNIYNDTGANQAKSGKAKIGYIVEFNLSLQNDGDQADIFKLSVNAGSTTMYRLKFYRGSTDITTKVMAGTYATPTIAQGGAVVITVDVIVKKEATAGSSVTRLVTITSVGDNGQLDALKFTAARK